MKIILTPILILLIVLKTTAQSPEHTAPTLQIGLDGLSLGKGMLDSELILQIIAEKQGEVKLRVAQNILLTSLKDGGGTIYAYGDNVLRAIIEEKDPVLRKRKILESLVNTLFAVSFKEYFEHKINTTPNSSEYQAYNKLANLITKDISLKISNELDLNNLIFSETNEKANTSIKLDSKISIETNKHILFNALILDIATEAIRKNRQFDELGVFNISYSKTYEYQSHFLNPNFQIKETFDSKFSDLNRELITSNSMILYEAMAKELKQLGDLIGFFNLIIDRGAYKYNESNLEAILNSFNNQNPIPTNFGPSIASITNLLSRNNLNDKQFNTLTSLKLYIQKAETLTSNLSTLQQNANLSDIIYSFEREFIPKIIDLGLNNSDCLDLIENLRNNSSNLALHLINEIELNNLFNEGKIFLFIKLLSQMYEFDKSNTYINYINFSFKIADVFSKSNSSGSKISESVDYFNTFIKDHIILTKDIEGEDFIDFKIESFLAKLTEMKTLQPTRIKAVFDVGASAGTFKAPFTIDGNQLNNLSFVGEKIGVKYNFIDRKFWKSRNLGEVYKYYGKEYLKTAPPMEPVVSNYYLLLYGTGILYNLFDTSTENAFNSPFLGTGIGIGFYNNLDLSFTATVPIISNLEFQESFKFSLFSINFDIRFNEYFQRLGEKRKASQTMKALAEAESNK